MKNTLIFIISFYQRYLSLDQGFIRKYIRGGGPVVCRYYPTCSSYTKEAIQKYGSWNGCIMGIRRILRCHPWSTYPHHDPVP